METYKIVRFYFDHSNHDDEDLETGLTLEEAQEHCNDPETSSITCTQQEGLDRTEQFGMWFDGYTEE